MKKLIINADDFGYREEINKGIIFAYQNGVVTSTSLFVEKAGTEQAIELAKENPNLGIGPHIYLDMFFEVDHHTGKIIDWVNPKPNLDDVTNEIRRQIEKYYSFGFSADHIDSHHHAHLHSDLLPIMCDIAKEYNIAVVRFSPENICPKNGKKKVEDIKNHMQKNGLFNIDHFIEGWYWGNIDEPYNIAELMTHPGYGEIWRESELAHCCQPKLKEYMKEQEIHLVRFCDIAENK